MEGAYLCVQDLIQSPSLDIDKAHSMGMTGVMAAAQGGHLDCLVTLLAGSADVRLTDLTGSSALHHAASEGNTECALMLMDAGVDCNLAADDSANRVTALMLAAINSNSEVVAALLNSASINVNQAANDGATALFLASLRGNNGIVKQLLACEETSVTILDHQNSGSLHWAVCPPPPQFPLIHGVHECTRLFTFSLCPSFSSLPFCRSASPPLRLSASLLLYVVSVAPKAEKKAGARLHLHRDRPQNRPHTRARVVCVGLIGCERTPSHDTTCHAQLLGATRARGDRRNANQGGGRLHTRG